MADFLDPNVVKVVCDARGDALYFSGASSLQEAYDIFLMPEVNETVNRFIFATGFTWNITAVPAGLVP